jgi:D-serine deaminase-like pyridoxal phosphate-dependent protein
VTTLDLTTPALLVERRELVHNLDTMAAALPGPRLRPHVKAHKCLGIARLQAEQGHRSFTCATVREVEGLAAAGLGEDVLLANEVADAGRLGRLEARVTVAVDSADTIAAAARGGVKEVVIDVNVGLPRCGCDPGAAGQLADLARRSGLVVRGVMGYEGHVVGLDDRAIRSAKTAQAMALLRAAHADVGGDLISAGGTGTYDINTWATEIQAGSYALMDTAYARLGLPFRQALSVLATVISVNAGFAVADCGLKALGMDHGNPTIAGTKVWFCSDEHVTFGLDDNSALPVEGEPLDAPRTVRTLRVGDRVRVWPAHVDPTMAYHERVHLVAGVQMLECWPIELRGW